MSELNTENGKDLPSAETSPETVKTPTTADSTTESTVQTTVEETSETAVETEEKTPVYKKIINIFSYVLLAFSLLTVIFTVFASSTFNKKKEVFGVKMYVVLSDSMKATDFAAGDLIFIKEVDPESLQEGDVIAFISQNKESYGETVTHKIRTKTVDDKGKPGFITYGTTTGTDDAVIVTYEWIEGKYVGRVPAAGRFFNFLKTPKGYITFVLLPFAFLIVVQGWNCVVAYREYRGEKTDELKTEREKLQKEKEENQRMLEEMRLLREELKKQKEQGARKEETEGDDAP